jgi:hypothetical protein
MNPVKLRIKEYVESLPDELSALKDVALRYLKYCSSIESDNTLHIAHKPWLGSGAYAIVLFQPVRKTWIKKFKERRIPKSYQNFLLATNGLFAFGLSLYGLTPSMQLTPPKLDRSKLQCLDLGLANRDWIKEFDVDQNLFHFGSREYSHTENIGYFISDNLQVQAIRKMGGRLRHWGSIPEFLRDELNEAEKMAKKQTGDGWWN